MFRHLAKDCGRVELRHQKDSGANGERGGCHDIQSEGMRTIREDTHHILRPYGQMLQKAADTIIQCTLALRDRLRTCGGTRGMKDEHGLSLINGNALMTTVVSGQGAPRLDSVCT